MEANEMMINDWVQQQGCTSPSQVAGVTQGKIHTYWADGSKHAKDQYYFSPVPLTPEILEKNGFVKFEFGWKYTEEDITFYVDKEGMSLSLCGEYVDVHNDDIKFVHQYQHALRLCGLDELADNFKI